MEKLEFKKHLLKICDGILELHIESLSEQYGVPISELKNVVRMARANGMMEESLKIEEMILNDFKETEED